MLKHLVLISMAAFALLCWQQPAAAEKRIALILGNAEYKHTAALANPVNDAEDMAEKLRALDFDVIVATDLNKRDMERRIRLFSERLSGADVALFFYAGHGLGLRADGKNFLVPVDAELKRESDLDFEAIDLDLVLKQMERNARVSLIFLDACRDNPLATRLAQTSRNVQPIRGLNRVEKAVGMLIGLATSPGDVALDGEGRNSPYTTALLRHIGTEGLSVNDMMIEVRKDVLKDTGGEQVPWETSSLTGKFYFKPKAEEAGPTGSEISALREQIDRLQSSQSALLEAQQKQLELLQDKLKAATSADETSADEPASTEPTAEAEAVADLSEEPAAEAEATADLTEEPAAPAPPASREIAVDSAPKSAGEDETAESAEAETQTEATAEPTEVAALDAAAEPAAEKAEISLEIDQVALNREIQTALKELACYPGKIDGIWGRGTRGGVERFNKLANLDLDPAQGEPATLEALQAWDGAECPAAEVVHRKDTAPSKRTSTRKSAPPRTQRVERGHVDEGPSGGATIRQQRKGTTFDIETDTVHRLLRPAR